MKGKERKSPKRLRAGENGKKEDNAATTDVVTEVAEGTFLDLSTNATPSVVAGTKHIPRQSRWTFSKNIASRRIYEIHFWRKQGASSKRLRLNARQT